MTLSSWQVDEAVRYVASCCDPSGEVFGDMVDHICCLVEVRMDDGESFDEAFAAATGELPASEIEEVEITTLNLLNMKNKRSFWRAFRWWYVLIPPLCTALSIIITHPLFPNRYASDMSMQQGTAAFGKPDWNYIAEMAHSRTILREVSLRLYARAMINGEENIDYGFIKPEHYRNTRRITPKDILEACDRARNNPDKIAAETELVEWMKQQEKPEVHNFVYGIQNYRNPLFSITALQNIKTWTTADSGVLHFQYITEDGGIATNMLFILSEELQKYFDDKMFGFDPECKERFDGTSVIELLDAPIRPFQSLPDYHMAIVRGILVASILFSFGLWIVRWRKGLKVKQ